ncbi:hypothetical protein H4R18_001226 [Coemansia javaensis]|uniref:Ysc84 actin-binding domain-containing protein n=1 Tax=Coemansia javaensis TaxID=2761396 RepID=A0A9W8LKZ0_9FUNG|nr:hypothetical protein H4R18_001226 [Coemansia javaensis]
MNFGGGSGERSNSFAAPSFGDKLRMGFSQLQDSLSDIGEQFTLAKECTRAARIISEFVVPPRLGEIDDLIPADVLQKCRGIAVLSVIKAGFIWSGRVGTGVVCARLPDGTWSGPSAITTGGMGIGGQIGAQLTEVVMILNDDDAVRAFEENASLQLGSNVSVAAGPVGRSGELAAAVNTSHVAGVYSYSRSKGLFAGVSVEGSVIAQRKDVNREFYGRAAPPELILSGEIAPPQGVSEWEVLRAVLEERCTPPHHAYQPQQSPHHRQPSPYVATNARETLYDEDDAAHVISPNTAAAIGGGAAPAAGAPGTPGRP